MSQGTKIEWADDTINFAGGCSEARLAGGKMDPACVHCYARLMSVRSDGMMAALGKESIYEDVAVRAGGNTARWTGVFRWDRELMRRRFAAMRGGRRVFPGSMTDLWHEGHNPGLLVALAEEIRALGDRPASKRPIVITLTKREQRLLAWQREHFPEGLPPWMWPGVTAGNQPAADRRVSVLLQVRARGPKVVSVEPMTGPVSLARWLPRVAGPWGARPPATWDEVVWPDWVPETIRRELAKFWQASYGRSPAHYEQSIRTAAYEDVPNFGQRGRYDGLIANLPYVEGRYVHMWNNIGMVVRDDGTAICTSISGREENLPVDRRSGHSSYEISAIGWVITGAESGQKARPSHPDWFRALRDECAAAGVPLLHKQNGEHIEVAPEKARRGDVWLVPRPTLTEGVEGMHTQLWQPGDAGAEAGRWSKFRDVLMRRVGKAAAGRELDGRTWDEIPSVAS